VAETRSNPQSLYLMAAVAAAHNWLV